MSHAWQQVNNSILINYLIITESNSFNSTFQKLQIKFLRNFILFDTENLFFSAFRLTGEGLNVFKFNIRTLQKRTLF
jgi:hypothetical protein